MHLLGQGEHDLFILALVLIVVVYFVGVSTEAGVFGQTAVNLGNTFTGRNPQGAFANYPS